MRQINIAYQELKENMVNLINHAGVPMFMVQELLELIQNKVTVLADQELEQARQKEKEEAEKQQRIQNKAALLAAQEDEAQKQQNDRAEK